MVKTPVKSAEKIPLVYVLAASHSGSTLLAMLLNSHPEVASVGELKATSLGDIERYRCSCQHRIKDCPFWLGISQDMAQYGIDFKIWEAGTDLKSGTSNYIKRVLRPLHRGPVAEFCRDVALALSPSWRKHLKKIQATNAALMYCILKRTGKKFVVDSSKIGIRLKYLLQNPALDVKIIRLMRDGRAVALTYTQPDEFADAADPKLRGGGMGGNRTGERLSIAEASREWLRSNEEAEAILNQGGRVNAFEIRYEHLCAEPIRALKNLLEFIGVDSSAKMSDFRSVDHHIIGNGMRLDSSEKIRLDERWKLMLSDADLKTFESIAGKMNRRLGYA
jgi:hypothetical protein